MASVPGTGPRLRWSGSSSSSPRLHGIHRDRTQYRTLVSFLFSPDFEGAFHGIRRGARAPNHSRRGSELPPVASLTGYLFPLPRPFFSSLF